MAQHFLLSTKSRTISLAKIFRLTDDEAYAMFRELRWPEDDEHCPHCGGLEPYEYKSRKIFCCRECGKQFSITSGTIFHGRKMAIRDYLAAIAIFVNGAKGISALQLSRDLDCQYRTAYKLTHKLREIMAIEQASINIEGEIEIDGGWFGGYVKPKNRKEDRVDRRRSVNKSGKRRVVVVARERGGRTITTVAQSEGHASTFLMDRIKNGSFVYTDEATAWEPIRDYYQSASVDHGELYSHFEFGIHTNNAESYFSRLRRAEIGQHHCVSKQHLAAYAAEMAWREDHRRMSNGDQFNKLVALAAFTPKSRMWAGY